MKKFCVMIPTCNRPNHLRRLLNYYDDSEFNFDVIIADSSSEKNKIENKKSVLNLNNIDAVHLTNWVPENNNFGLVMKKTVYTLSQVKNKYCVYCADDDFYSPHAIDKCVNFLEHNLDYSIAIGNTYSFKLVDGCFLYSGITDLDSIDMDDVEKRLFYYLYRILYHDSKYPGIVEGVYRTKLMNFVWNETLKYSSDARFSELIVNAISLIYSKVKYIDVFHIIRQISDVSMGNKAETFGTFVSDGTFNERCMLAKRCLIENLVKKEMDIKNAQRIVDRYYTNYFNKSRGYLLPKIDMSLRRLNLPKFLDRTLRKNYRNFFKHIIKPVGNNNCYVDNIEEDMPEMNKIKKYCLLFQ